MIERPVADEMSPYYRSYVALVPEEDVLGVLTELASRMERELSGLAPAQLAHRYAPGKWSIKEVVGHLTDSERIFGTRAVVFARGDRTPWPGFDENAYVQAGCFDRRSFQGLIEEFVALRRANVCLFADLDVGAAAQRGIANGTAMSARAIPWVLAGHQRHHLQVVRERYLPTLPAS